MAAAKPGQPGDRGTDLLGAEPSHRRGHAANVGAAAPLRQAQNGHGQSDIALDGTDQLAASERIGMACCRQRPFARGVEDGQDVELHDRRAQLADPLCSAADAALSTAGLRLAGALHRPRPLVVLAGERRDEAIHDRRIELAAAFLHDELEGALRPGAATVRPVGRDCHERVADGDHATGKRDRLTRQPDRVSVAVPPLVMSSDERRRPAHARQRMQQLGPRARGGSSAAPSLRARADRC